LHLILEQAISLLLIQLIFLEFIFTILFELSGNKYFSYDLTEHKSFNFTWKMFYLAYILLQKGAGLTNKRGWVLYRKITSI
jgi:hypothetical protein